MLVPIFLILVAMQAWSWSPGAYPFLAFLIVAGVMVTNNFLLMLVYWLGVTWAGYLIFLPYWQKTPPTDGYPHRDCHPSFTESEAPKRPAEIESLFQRILIWHITTDVILLMLLLLINIRPTPSVDLDIHTFPDAAWLSASPNRRGVIFVLGASVPLLKALTWALIPKKGSSFMPLEPDQTYVCSFVVSTGLVAAYQVVRLGYACLPFALSPMGTVGMITSIITVAYLLYRWLRSTQTKHIGWHPLTVLPLMGKTVFHWDRIISLVVVELSVTSLDTMGTALIEFEFHLIQLGQSLMRCLLAVQEASKRLYRLIVQK
jgi:hypothetical protein